MMRWRQLGWVWLAAGRGGHHYSYYVAEGECNHNHKWWAGGIKRSAMRLRVARGDASRNGEGVPCLACRWRGVKGAVVEEQLWDGKERRPPPPPCRLTPCGGGVVLLFNAWQPTQLTTIAVATPHPLVVQSLHPHPVPPTPQVPSPPPPRHAAPAAPRAATNRMQPRSAKPPDVSGGTNEADLRALANVISTALAQKVKVCMTGRRGGNEH